MERALRLTFTPEVLAQRPDTRRQAVVLSGKSLGTSQCSRSEEHRVLEQHDVLNLSEPKILKAKGGLDVIFRELHRDGGFI